jgi:DUF1680 family protein
MIESAQQPDGYLDIYFTVVDPEGRFKNMRDMHEQCLCSFLTEEFSLIWFKTMLDIYWRVLLPILLIPVPSNS